MLGPSWLAILLRSHPDDNKACFAVCVCGCCYIVKGERERERGGGGEYQAGVAGIKRGVEMKRRGGNS